MKNGRKGVTTIKVLYCFEYIIVENDIVDKLHMHANLFYYEDSPTAVFLF